MYRSSLKFFLILPLLFISTSVPPGAAEKPKPTVCKQCDRNIGETNKKFAVYVMQGIEPSSFDDTGCTILWRSNECAMRQSAFDDNAVVHDHAYEEPVPAEKALYAAGSGIKTSMGYDVLAFNCREQAEKFASVHGKASVLRYNELLSS
jgi:nitrous oxide reductase accessory protein NosL